MLKMSNKSLTTFIKSCRDEQLNEILAISSDSEVLSKEPKKLGCGGVLDRVEQEEEETEVRIN